MWNHQIIGARHEGQTRILNGGFDTLPFIICLFSFCMCAYVCIWYNLRWMAAIAQQLKSSLFTCLIVGLWMHPGRGEIEPWVLSSGSKWSGSKKTWIQIGGLTLSFSASVIFFFLSLVLVSYLCIWYVLDGSRTRLKLVCYWIYLEWGGIEPQ